MQCVDFRDPVERLAERIFQCVDRAEFPSAEFVLDLREDLLDRVEVGTVGRQEEDAIKVTQAQLTFVALDERGQPRIVTPM